MISLRSARGDAQYLDVSRLPRRSVPTAPARPAVTASTGGVVSADARRARWPRGDASPPARRAARRVEGRQRLARCTRITYARPRRAEARTAGWVNRRSRSYHGWYRRNDSESDAPSYVPTGGCGARSGTTRRRSASTGCPTMAEPAARLGGGVRGVRQAAPVDHLPAPDCVVTDWTVKARADPVGLAPRGHARRRARRPARGIVRCRPRARSRGRTSQTRSRSAARGEAKFIAAWVNVYGKRSSPPTSPAASTPTRSRARASRVSYRFLARRTAATGVGRAYRAEGLADAKRRGPSSSPPPSRSGRPGSAARPPSRPRSAQPRFLTSSSTATASRVSRCGARRGRRPHDLRGERWTGERTSGGLTASDGAVVRLRKWLRRSGGPPLKPAEKSDVRRGARATRSRCGRCTRATARRRRAHDDAEAKKVLLVAAAAAAASGELAAVTLLMTSELSRRTALWFETEDVKFDR